jgi:hypothetical protein
MTSTANKCYDYAQLEWPPIETMTADQIKDELIEQRTRYETIEKDLTKQMAETRKVKA